MTERARLRPIPRIGARVLLLDACDRVLLFRIADSAGGLEPIWNMPRGRLEEGEPRQAAAGELEEETSLRDVTAGLCLVDSGYAAPAGAAAPLGRPGLPRGSTATIAAATAAARSRELIAETRWWSLDAIEAATREVFVPRDVASAAPDHRWLRAACAYRGGE